MSNAIFFLLPEGVIPFHIVSSVIRKITNQQGSMWWSVLKPFTHVWNRLRCIIFRHVKDCRPRHAMDQGNALQGKMAAENLCLEVTNSCSFDGSQYRWLSIDKTAHGCSQAVTYAKRAVQKKWVASGFLAGWESPHLEVHVHDFALFSLNKLLEKVFFNDLLIYQCSKFLMLAMVMIFSTRGIWGGHIVPTFAYRT